MIFKKKYNIIVIPNWSSATKQFFISKILLLFTVLIFCITLAIGLLGILKIEENIKLAEENLELKTQNSKLSEVSEVIKKLKKEESLIKGFLGIDKESSNEDIHLGQGGIDSNTEIIEIEPLFNEEKGQEAEKDMITNSVEMLDRFQKISTIMSTRQKKWDYIPTINPVTGKDWWMSSSFGWRISPMTGRRQFHRGVDIASRLKTPIIVTANGKVIKIAQDKFLGNYIIVKHNKSLITKYGHLNKILVKKGQEVNRGEKIGLMGNTGLSTGSHLHYEVIKDKRHLNPNNYIYDVPLTKPFLAENKDYNSL